MNKLKPLIAALALTAIVAVPLAAQAFQGGASAAGLQGKTVVGQDGAVLGHVERVILNAAGAPAQVLVRPKGVRAGGPRSLSFKALSPKGDDLAAPLSKAEFDAMPAVEAGPN